MQQINNTTFQLSGLGDVAPLITLGGSDSKKFALNMNMSFSFGGGEECYDNINRTDKITSSSSELKFDGKRIRLIEGSDIDELYVDGNGLFKWDVIFESCPESMVIEWRRKCSPGLTAHYQGTLENDRNTKVLDIEEYLHKRFREERAIGSYAIYCDKAHNYIIPVNTKKEIPDDWKTQLSAGATLADVNIHSYREYKTGKIGHKYRPFVIDANDKIAWCSLLIIGNIERVTLPEDFMKTAAYPVRLDPTFGYTSTGASHSYHDTYSDIRGSLYGNYTASSGDTITGISVYGRNEYSGILQISLASYSVSGGVLNSRLGSNATITGVSNVAQWRSTGTLSNAMSAGAVYNVAFGQPDGSFFYYYDTGTDYTDRYSGYTLPETWSSAYKDSEIISIYTTYTTGVSGNSYYYQQQQM